MQPTRALAVLFAGAAITVTAASAHAQNVAGQWVAEIHSPSILDPAYARVSLTRTGDTLSGTWGEDTLKGSVKASEITLTLTDAKGQNEGSITGKLDATSGEGSGTIAGLNRRPGRMSFRPPTPEPVTWKLTRPATPPAHPRDIHYEPKRFQPFYYAGNKPDLHIFPGDVVHTWAPDSAGHDSHDKLVALGGDANIGPIYVEGALPGDTLVVHLISIEPNRDTARQGSRLNQFAATTAYSVRAKYDPRFSGLWHLDNATNTATLASPTPGLKDWKVKMKPMLGCISVAPRSEEALHGNDLGPFGGNLDYNGVVAGTTLYFPVSHPGALFGFGDGHAAMGDGEVTGTGLETSMNVTFTVDIIKGFQTQQVREEDPNYLISFGVAGSVPEAIKAATTQLAEWLERDYGLTANEAGIFLGTEMKYEITELVDPRFDVVAKVPKSALAMLHRTAAATEGEQ